MAVNSNIKSMKSRIWSALLCASDQEIHEGMHFYSGAYGLCRFLGRVFNVKTETCAGLYAAMSPMSTWDTNVSNIVDLLRYTRISIDTVPGMVVDLLREGSLYPRDIPPLNTTIVNRIKALRIALGVAPLDVLKGHKVRAFYHCIANPHDDSQMVIDRHLINLALGVIPGKAEQSNLANDRSLIADIAEAYRQLGKRERIGNRLASIAWFVQRRIERTGQTTMHHSESPVHCNRPMCIQGSTPGRRFICLACDYGYFERSPVIDGYGLSRCRDRTTIHLGHDHPYANKWGWQYLARYRMMKDLGRVLRSDEHVHHIDHDHTNDQPDNLQLILAEYHGRYHGLMTVLARYRDDLGRFVEDPEPAAVPMLWPRDGAILGYAQEGCV